jgi:hypothetical protein
MAVVAVEFYLLRSDNFLLFGAGLCLVFVHGAVMVGLGFNMLLVARDWRRVMQGRSPVILDVDRLLAAPTQPPVRRWKGKTLDFLALATPFYVPTVFLVGEIINVSQMELTRLAILEHQERQQIEMAAQKKAASRFVVDQGTRRFFAPTIGPPAAVG